MATGQMSEVIQHLRRAVLLHDGAGLTDGQLLDDYLRRRDEAALAALVRRHGPMVWGVCRRLLRNQHDAEDAFQATFLVLVRKAAGVLPREMVANWLYGVAHQTALKARATTAKRRTRERQVADMPEPAMSEQNLWHDLQPLLDQELSRLPDNYRVAIVLCDLEGKTRKEAARQLGVPEGTLAARVARGRVILAKRLARYGLTVSGGALGTMLAQEVASAGVPTSVVSSTVKAASLFAAGQTAAAGLISAKAAALTEGVLKSMLLSKLKVAVVVMLAIGALAIVASALPDRTVAAEPPSRGYKSAKFQQDDGNVKETVLALVKRIWEAHSKHDVDTFKNLLADDYLGLDLHRNPYRKANALEYVRNYRVEDAAMSNVQVILLNASSAIVTYEIRFKVRSADGKLVETRADHNTTAWAQRNGKWWAVFTESTVIDKDRTFLNVLGFDGERPHLRFNPQTGEQAVEGLSETLKKLNAEKKPPKD
jgi:RNA polymerase sigma factor (sigma-70 family)